MIEHDKSFSRIETEQHETLTPEKTGILLFSTFRFSQGQPDLEGKLFLWLNRQFPGYRIDNESFKSVLETAQKRNSTYILKRPGSMHAIKDASGKAITSINFATETALSKMQAVFNGNRSEVNQYKDLSDSELLETIREDMILYDTRHLESATGRKRTVDYIPNKPETDPRSSQFVDYVLKGLETGTPEYNKMFREIKAAFIKSVKEDLDKKIPRNVSKVVLLYNEYHLPEQQINLESLITE